MAKLSIDPSRSEKHKLYCLKDSKSLSYGPPFAQETKGQAIRFIQDGLASGQPVWARHPQDFTLFEIGEYDVLTGSVENYEAKIAVGLVQDFKVSSDAVTQ